MCRIGGLPRPQQRQRRRRAAQQKQRRPLADVDPLARLIKRLAARTAEGLQAVKAVDCEPAQAVGAAHQHGIHQPGRQQPLAADEGARAGGAGGGDSPGRPGQAEMAGQKFRRRAQLLLTIVKGGRHGLPAPGGGHRQLGLADPGSAGAKHQPHSRRAMGHQRLVEGGPHLGQRRQQQLVVARGVGGQRRRYGRQLALHPPHRGQAAIQQRRPVAIQRAHARLLPGQQRLGAGIAPHPQCRDEAIGGDITAHWLRVSSCRR